MIPKADVREGAKFVSLAADLLLSTTSNEGEGRQGADLRRACGDLKAHAEAFIIENTIAAKLSDCFDLARISGALLSEFNYLRQQIQAEAAVSLVATLLKNVSIQFSLQQMSLTVLQMTFTSRDDVVTLRNELNVAFDEAEEVAADEMAQEDYFALITLHAAVTFHMYDTARPLPQMLGYQFGTPKPTLVLSHRLYSTAARADQLREENKVVHPAFAPREGQALAF
jgi:prophage DNA circulation protein